MASYLHSAGHVFYHGALFIVWILRFELTFCVCINSSMVLVYTLFPDSILFCRPGWLQTLGSQILPNTGITGVCNHTGSELCFFFLMILKIHLKVEVADVESFCLGHSLGSCVFVLLCFLTSCFGVKVMLNSKLELECICLFRGSFTESVPYLNCLEKPMVGIVWVLSTLFWELVISFL